MNASNMAEAKHRVSTNIKVLMGSKANAEGLSEQPIIAIHRDANYRSEEKVCVI